MSDTTNRKPIPTNLVDEVERMVDFIESEGSFDNPMIVLIYAMAKIAKKHGNRKVANRKLLMDLDNALNTECAPYVTEYYGKYED